MHNSSGLRNFISIQCFMKTHISFLWLLSIALPGVSQQIENTTVTQTTDSTNTIRYTFQYDLMAGVANIPCEVRLKVWSSDKQFYAKEVLGDVGPMIYPGKFKEMHWYFGKDLVHYSGDIKYTIEVQPHIKVNEKVKRGKTLTIQLTENLYPKGEKQSIKLMKGSVEVAHFTNMEIQQNFEVSIHSKTKVRKGYQISIGEGENALCSNLFKVKPEVARIWYVLAGASVAATYFFLQEAEENKPLPGAPEID